MAPADPDRGRARGARAAAEPRELKVEGEGITFQWRAPLTDAEMVELVRSHGGRAVEGWWDRIRPYSLGWVVARAEDGSLVGFVNVAWDGGDHAFLLDPKTRGELQRRGIGTRLVSLAAQHAKAAGCEWLHVDFEPELEPFYFEACGFRPTPAGLIHLPSQSVASLPEDPPASALPR